LCVGKKKIIKGDSNFKNGFGYKFTTSMDVRQSEGFAIEQKMTSVLKRN